MNLNNSLGSSSLLHAGYTFFDAWDLADYVNREGLRDLAPFKRLELQGETFYQFAGMLVYKASDIWEPITETGLYSRKGLCKCEDCKQIGIVGGRNQNLKKICDSCAKAYGVCSYCGLISKELEGKKKPICRSCTHARYKCDVCSDYHVGPCIKRLGGGFNDRGRWPDIRPHGGKTKFPFYAGMELEINTSDSVKTLQMIRETYPDLFWGTRDGTVDGIELVSMPATLEFWQGVDLKFYSGCQEGRAGIHIHVDRFPHEHFQLLGILEFFEKNKTFVFKLAERQSDFAKIHPLSYYTEKAGDDLTGFTGGEKYSALNFNHRKTLEYRLFNSTLKMNNIKKDIEFCFALWDWTKRGAFKTTKEDFTKFCHSEKQTFPYLSEYIQREAA